MRYENGMESTTPNIRGIARALKQDRTFAPGVSLPDLRERARVFDLMLFMSRVQGVDLMMGEGGELFYADPTTRATDSLASQQ